ncbi:hypothetical protein E4T56_gene21024, partial [Termitomyces sp. T112]
MPPENDPSFSLPTLQELSLISHMDQTVEPMSPSRPSSHSISNFSPNYDTKSVRAGLIHDLKRFGIHVDDEFVLKEVLKIDEASLKDADACADLLRSTHRKDIESLQKVVMHGKVKDEKHMYNPLENLCRTIATYGSKSPRRHLVITNSKHLESESHFTGSLIPDLCAVEVGNGEVESIKTRDGKVFLRQVAAFAEVKKSDKDDPVPARSSATLNTAQVADYAAMLFIGRPFNLFVIGLSICGNKFRVGYFDRSGILFSEARDMFSKQGLPIFIKVIRRITCDMSNIDLGHNPNIHLLEGHTYYQNEYPKFRVDTGHQSSYVTEGRPLWISFSYLGRGTSTWVASSSGGVKLVLKFAWRSENRRGEASIYNDVGEMPGVARLMDGGDMMWKQRGLGQISIRSIRNLDPKVKFERNVILHFVGINPIGKMLWDAKDDLEFCLGIWAAIKGYRRLNKKKGFLHRDISPGNVFIWDEFQNGKPAPSDDEIGFLADLEFASFPTSQSIYVARPRETVTRLPSGKTVTTPIDSSRISSKNLSNTAVHSVFEEVAITKSGAGPEMTRQDPDSSNKSLLPQKEPRLFVPFRALGLITNYVPFVLQRRAWALWEGGKMTLLFVGPDAPEQISNLAMDGDAVWAAAGPHALKYIRGKEVLRVTNPLGTALSFITIFGSQLLALTEDGSRMILWDTEDGNLDATIEFEAGFTATLILHPVTYLNKILVSSSEGSTQLWNVRSQICIHKFPLHRLQSISEAIQAGSVDPSCAITSMVQSPAVDVVGIGFASGEISVYDVRADERLMRMFMDGGGIRALGFRSDGHPVLASASSAGHLALWDLNSGGRLLHMI